MRWLLVFLLGCSSAPAEEVVAVESAPAADAEEQFERALAGDLDPQAAHIDAAVRAHLGEDWMLVVGDFDWSGGVDELLADDHVMLAWGVIATEFAIRKQRHTIEHPQCTFVGNVLGGWTHAVEARLEEALGTTRAGSSVFPSALLYFAKKAAFTFDETISEAFVYADHCVDDPGSTCGVAAAPCCAGSCGDGLLCHGGVCL